VLNATFTGLSGGPLDNGAPLKDPVFKLGGANTRRVAPATRPP
jgi:hypothetical protein